MRVFRVLVFQTPLLVVTPSIRLFVHNACVMSLACAAG